MAKYEWTKARILRWTLGVSGWIFCIVLIFVVEQYYRWHVCNFASRDGEPHSYNIYEGATLDSLFTLLREDYEISTETDPFYSAANMERLRRAAAEMDAGLGRAHELIGDDHA